MVMKRVYIYPFEMRISPIDSYESQLSIGAILVFNRQILMHFMGHFRILVISTIFDFEKIVHKILSAACSMGGGIERMKLTWNVLGRIYKVSRI